MHLATRRCAAPSFSSDQELDALLQLRVPAAREAVRQACQFAQCACIPCVARVPGSSKPGPSFLHRRGTIFPIVSFSVTYICSGSLDDGVLRTLIPDGAYFQDSFSL